MKIIRLLAVASAAFFIVGAASAQNVGTVTNHALPIGQGAGKQGFKSLLLGSGQLAMGQSAADPTAVTVSGDVTIGPTGVTAIGTAKVTYAMMQNVAALSVIGRSANSSGVPAAISCVAASDAVLRESGSVLGCGTIATNGIANNAVTNAKLATMANATFKCRNTAGTGNPEDCTATQATALLNAMVGDSGSGGTKGMVPAPASGDAAAGKYLKADGTYAVPPGGSGLAATTKAAQQTGTDNATAVTPARQQDHDSALKAHAYVSTSSPRSPVVTSGYNVSGCTSASTGLFVCTFSTSFTSATAFNCIPSLISSSGPTSAYVSAQTASTVTIITIFGGAVTDPVTAVTLHCAGRQ